ncbi:fasciclin domain-containing protein [Streptomyces sp. NPDC002055]|uniref:fasciclin domain-containing protein n=1 Tax=Streptomyces sp. NPDC002055 TaxID=3154534 RepID=UPI00332D7A23
MSTLLVRRTTLAVAAAVLLPFSLAACSSGDMKDKASGSEASSPASDSEKGDAGGKTDTMTEPFGPACSTIPKSGKGSFDGMAEAPVATAASNNPALSTLVTAVKKAGLVDTLNSSKNITVFAPTNDAFEKIPKAQLDKVLADKATLTRILTGHVVGEEITPKQLADGSYTTLAKSELTTSGSGMSYKVDDAANVVCGNVQTSNATVHIIDSVLMPE